MTSWQNLTSAAVLPINPHYSVLGKENAVLSGSSTEYYVPDFEGSLSIKSTVTGSAMWEAGGRRFTVHENSYLILNDRQHYTMTIDSTRKVTTFCLFFRRGFVEDIFRATVTRPSVLLDSPEPNITELGFFEKLESDNSPVLGLIQQLRERLGAGVASSEAFEDDFASIATAMIHEHRHPAAAAARLPAARHSTRDELYRRLLQGRDYLLSSLDRPVRLAEVARAACLSTYHFHREFRRLFSETPHQYLTRHRLERAKVLLAQENSSIIEVCLASGFESQASFSLLFRRSFGCSPRQFRQAKLQISKNR
jgi:AraC family transcriptional regulator